MKLFIVLALASVALATPLVQPVVMPEAPLPEFEDKPYVPMIEPVAIKPLFVPQEVIDALILAEEQVPANAEAVFEAMEQAGEADVVHVVEYVVYENDADQIAADAVHFVDVAENIDSEVAQEEVAAPAIEEIPADAVNFVDVAENIDSEVAQEEVAAPAVEEIPADAVNFVDVAENIDSEVAPAVEAIEHADEEVVHVVDYVVYENADHVAEEEAVADAAAEEILADAVNFVDEAENMEYSEVAEEQINAEEIIPEAVHFVDNAEDIVAAAGNVEEITAVKFVDVAPVADNEFPRYPGKIYDNPMLR